MVVHLLFEDAFASLGTALDQLAAKVDLDVLVLFSLWIQETTVTRDSHRLEAWSISYLRAAVR